ncbi:hypothetical protein HMSSN036_81820 [Paenibacillus macerans]|nr:hypothetical protein HMSSN036_81820 [Paenibacillus macerans]
MQFPASWLKSGSLGESIAAELRLQMVSGAIKPGEILSETALPRISEQAALRSGKR